MTAADDLKDRLRRDFNGNGQTGSADGALGPRLTRQKANEVKVVPPVWLWPRWLVAAAVQLLVGRQGAGKSTFAAWVVATLSTGRCWPCDDMGEREPVRCGMLSLEEPADRVAARLVGAGADLDRVFVLGDVEDHDDHGNPYWRRWQMPADCTALENTIRELHLKVVTIDGLGYSVRGDSHNYAVIGSALSSLAGVAERTGCAILGLTHPPKGNSDAVTAAIGSTAWTALARITWVLGADPTDETGARRVVRPAPGSNYRLPDHGLSFTVANHDETEAGYVTTLRISDVDPQTITSPPIPESGDGDAADAKSVLEEVLKDGPMWVKDAKQAMKEAGFTAKQTRTAKEAAGVRSVHHGNPKDKVQGWKWELPSTPQDAPDRNQGAQGAPREEEGTLGTFDERRAPWTNPADGGDADDTAEPVP